MKATVLSMNTFVGEGLEPTKFWAFKVWVEPPFEIEVHLKESKFNKAGTTHLVRPGGLREALMACGILEGRKIVGVVLLDENTINVLTKEKK